MPRYAGTLRAWKGEGVLKEKRKEAGLTQRELSELSGVPRRTLQDWEAHGAAKADAGRLARVARALGCAMEELLRKEEP